MLWLLLCWLSCSLTCTQYDDMLVRLLLQCGTLDAVWQIRP